MAVISRERGLSAATGTLADFVERILESMEKNAAREQMFRNRRRQAAGLPPETTLQTTAEPIQFSKQEIPETRPDSSIFEELVTGIERRQQLDQLPYEDRVQADALLSIAFRTSFT